MNSKLVLFFCVCVLGVVPIIIESEISKNSASIRFSNNTTSNRKNFFAMALLEFSHGNTSIISLLFVRKEILSPLWLIEHAFS